MTDCSRFQAVKGSSDAAYRQYYGARLVELVFWLVDCWGARAGRLMPRLNALQPDVQS